MPAFEDTAARHDSPRDARHLVGDGDRGDARRLSRQQGDEARIDRIGLLLGVSDQRGCADDQKLPQILVTHLGDPPQAFLAAARALSRSQPKPGSELTPRSELAWVGNRRGERGRADRADARDRCQTPRRLIAPLQGGEAAARQSR